MLFYEGYFLDTYNRQISEFVPSFNAWRVSKRITNIYRTATLISIVLWIVFVKDLLLLWIPMLITWVLAVVGEHIFMKMVPNILYNWGEKKHLQKIEEEEKLAQREKLLQEIAETKKSIEENTFGIPMCRRIVSELMEKPMNLCKDEFITILNQLSSLIDEVEKAGTDIDKYQMLFGKTISDVYRVIAHSENENKEAVLEMLKAMQQYIDSEIETIRLYPNMEIKSTIDAYTQLFKSKTGKEFFDD